MDRAVFWVGGFPSETSTMSFHDQHGAWHCLVCYRLANCYKKHRTTMVSRAFNQGFLAPFIYWKTAEQIFGHFELHELVFFLCLPQLAPCKCSLRQAGCAEDCRCLQGPQEAVWLRTGFPWFPTGDRNSVIWAEGSKIGYLNLLL